VQPGTLRIQETAKTRQPEETGKNMAQYKGMCLWKPNVFQICHLCCIYFYEFKMQVWPVAITFKAGQIKEKKCTFTSNPNQHYGQWVFMTLKENGNLKVIGRAEKKLQTGLLF